MPGPTISAATNYLHWHNTEAVTFKRSGESNLALQYGKRRAVRHNEITAHGGGGIARGMVWNLPAAEIEAQESGAVVSIDDQITAGSETWKVVSVELLTWQSRWRCVCLLEG